MSHEMVHNFLASASTPSQTTGSSNWLYEGINNNLPIYLPFRTKFRTGDYFSSTISNLCMKYYTNPLLHLPQETVSQMAADGDTYAMELLGWRA